MHVPTATPPRRQSACMSEITERPPPPHKPQPPPPHPPHPPQPRAQARRVEKNSKTAPGSSSTSSGATLVHKVRLHSLYKNIPFTPPLSLHLQLLFHLHLLHLPPPLRYLGLLTLVLRFERVVLGHEWLVRGGVLLRRRRRRRRHRRWAGGRGAKAG